MEPEKNIEKWLQEQFTDYEAEPERELWSGIEAGLQASAAPVKRVLWPRYVAVAASILLLIGVIWLLNQPQAVPEAPIAEQAPILPPQQLEEEEEMPTAVAVAPEDSAKQPIEQQATPEVVSTPKKRIVPTPVKQRIRIASREQVQTEALPMDERPRSHIQPKAMSPTYQQLALQQPIAARPEAGEGRPLKKLRPIAQLNEVDPETGQSRKLDLNELTLASAWEFASQGINDLARSPVQIYEEKTPKREVRTYELDLLNLKITRKTYKGTR